MDIRKFLRMVENLNSVYFYKNEIDMSGFRPRVTLRKIKKKHFPFGFILESTVILIIFATLTWDVRLATYLFVMYGFLIGLLGLLLTKDNLTEDLRDKEYRKREKKLKKKFDKFCQKEFGEIDFSKERKALATAAKKTNEIVNGCKNSLSDSQIKKLFLLNYKETKEECDKIKELLGDF